MHEVEQHGDVLRVRFWSRVSARVGYDASVYLTRGMMVDCAFPKVAAEVAALLDERRPSAVFVTHWHEDHAGNVPMLVSRRVPLVIADATVAMLRARPSIRLYRRITWGRPEQVEGEIGRAEGAEGGALRGLALTDAPGHSPDHHVVWDAERGTLFSADLFLGVKVRVAHPAERPRALVASLRRFAALRPERMFDTHRGRVESPAESLLAKAEWTEETIGAIEQKIAEGWSDAEIRTAVLGGESPDGYLSGMEYARINFVKAVRAGW